MMLECKKDDNVDESRFIKNDVEGFLLSLKNEMIVFPKVLIKPLQPENPHWFFNPTEKAVAIHTVLYSIKTTKQSFLQTHNVHVVHALLSLLAVFRSSLNSHPLWIGNYIAMMQN